MLNMADLPAATAVGFATILTVGTVVTVTTVLDETVPPDPDSVAVYVVVVLKLTD
jgi:hypothetical protein